MFASFTFFTKLQRAQLHSSSIFVVTGSQRTQASLTVEGPNVRDPPVSVRDSFGVKPHRQVNHVQPRRRGPNGRNHHERSKDSSNVLTEHGDDGDGVCE